MNQPSQKKRVDRLPIAELYFDPENPRLPQRYKGADDQTIIEYLLIECSLIELMNSIAEQGYFDGEPILVVPREGGGYTVVEGNRRLGALKLLTSSAPPPVMPQQVEAARQAIKSPLTEAPALVFEKREEILGYLGYRHITGINEWDALAKARYLQQLRKLKTGDDLYVYKQIAREIGSRSDVVAKLLTAAALLDQARDTGILRRMRVNHEDEIPFSLLSTALGYSNICKHIGLADSKDVRMQDLKLGALEELFSWIFDKSSGKTVIGESRNLDALARVVANAHAVSLLRKGMPLADADLHTEGPIEAVRKLMTKAENSLRSAVDALSFSSGFNDADATHAERLRKLGAQLHSSIRDAIENPNSDA